MSVCGKCGRYVGVSQLQLLHGDSTECPYCGEAMLARRVSSRVAGQLPAGATMSAVRDAIADTIKIAKGILVDLSTRRIQSSSDIQESKKIASWLRELIRELEEIQPHAQEADEANLRARVAESLTQLCNHYGSSEFAGRMNIVQNTTAPHQVWGLMTRLKRIVRDLVVASPPPKSEDEIPSLGACLRKFKKLIENLRTTKGGFLIHDRSLELTMDWLQDFLENLESAEKALEDGEDPAGRPVSEEQMARGIARMCDNYGGPEIKGRIGFLYGIEVHDEFRDILKGVRKAAENSERLSPAEKRAREILLDAGRRTGTQDPVKIKRAEALRIAISSGPPQMPGTTVHKCRCGQPIRVAFEDLRTRGPCPSCKSKITLHTAPPADAVPEELAQVLEPIRCLQGHKMAVNSVALSNSARYALSGGSDYTVRLWDLSSGRSVRTLKVDDYKWIFDVALSGDARWALSCGDGSDIRLWNLEKAQCVHLFNGHQDRVFSVAFSDDRKWAVSGGDDRIVRVWDVERGLKASAQSSPCVREFRGHAARVNSVTFSRDGLLALSGSGDMSLRLWNVAGSDCLREFTGTGLIVNAVALSADSKLALSGGDKLQLWEVDSGRCIRTFGHFEGEITDVAFSSDDKNVVAASSDGGVRLWQTESGALLAIAFEHEPETQVTSVALSGRVVVSGGLDCSVRVYRLDAAAQQVPSPSDVRTAPRQSTQAAVRMGEESLRACLRNLEELLADLPNESGPMNVAPQKRKNVENWLLNFNRNLKAAVEALDTGKNLRGQPTTRGLIRDDLVRMCDDYANIQALSLLGILLGTKVHARFKAILDDVRKAAAEVAA